MAAQPRGSIPAMKKRRLEIALAALLLLAAGERSSFSTPDIGLDTALYQVGDFAPQRIETVRDLGLVAARLLISWID